ncbi:uncharacterized protein LOC124253195 isoform X2 [Haliotis rubra]|uniref:uncharacterized protein LOC124253195 isoform X2 n=1 Tax=Haliotis rubra TaxID=36100 RepID=UPI001EE55F24|nr:uncharacterized protein LOC124253195 isoform X2 [Haliotis rubra]
MDGCLVLCLMVLAGCLVFISSGDAARGNVGVALNSKSSNTRSSNTRSTTKRKQKRVKGKVKYREEFPDEHERKNTDNEPRRHKGTYGLTAATWEAAFMRGDVYNGVAYFDTVRYNNTPDTMPTICQNVDVYDNTNANDSTDVSDNTTQPVLPGLFYCPGDDDDDDKNFCCGDEETEYCCAGPVNSEFSPVAIGALFGGIFLIAGIAVFFVWRKKRQGQLKLEEKVPPQEKAAEPMLAPNTAVPQQLATGAPVQSVAAPMLPPQGATVQPPGYGPAGALYPPPDQKAPAVAYPPQLPPDQQGYPPQPPPGQQVYPPQPPPDQQGYPPQPPPDQAAPSEPYPPAAEGTPAGDPSPPQQPPNVAYPLAPQGVQTTASVPPESSDPPPQAV